jgi:hypothetical protein
MTKKNCYSYRKVAKFLINLKGNYYIGFHNMKRIPVQATTDAEADRLAAPVIRQIQTDRYKAQLAKFRSANARNEILFDAKLRKRYGLELI